MTVAVVLVLLAVTVAGLVIGIAMETGPTAAEVAVGYEHAWDRLDFDAVWHLSGEELRDGRSRAEFVAAKRAAYAEQPGLRRLTADVEVEDAVTAADGARVVTRVTLRDGSVVRDELRLVRRRGEWEVVGYELLGVGGVAG
ncbi:MAG: DUF4878 domain-containing protein [Acidimicrobiia bacterium]|nr:DUF4878 domain-containing protein [Acidimicrobiia bacterium]